MIKILSYEYDVRLEPGYSKNANKNNYEKNEATIDFIDQVIILDPDHKEHRQALLHELLHAIGRFWAVDMDENTIERLSNGLYHVLTDNGVDITPLIDDQDDHELFLLKT